MGAFGIDPFAANYPTFDTFTVVPEPATYAAGLGIGALALAWYRRRRRSMDVAS